MTKVCIYINTILFRLAKKFGVIRNYINFLSLFYKKQRSWTTAFLKIGQCKKNIIDRVL